MLNKQQAQELLAKIIQTIKMHLCILEPGKEERFICRNNRYGKTSRSVLGRTKCRLRKS